MALMNCPECGKQVSDAAQNCPDCGFPIGNKKEEVLTKKEETLPKKKKFDWKLILLIFLCIFSPFLGLVFLWIFKRPKKIWKRILLTVFLFLYFLVTLVSSVDKNDSNTSKEVVEEISEVEEVVEEPEEIQKEAKEEAENVEEQKEETVKRKEEKENSKSFEYADMTVEFVEYAIEENSIGEQCLVLYFDFTNNYKESQAFGYTFTVKAFQDGVALDHTYFHVNKETENSDKEIKPGVTLRVAEQFGIDDISGTINIEIEPFNIWSDKTLLDYEFSLD